MMNLKLEEMTSVHVGQVKSTNNVAGSSLLQGLAKRSEVTNVHILSTLFLTHGQKHGNNGKNNVKGREYLMKAKSAEWFGAILFTVVGAIFITIGLAIFTNEMSFKNNAIEKVAIITNIETYRSGDDTNYRVYVRYVVNNETYNQTLNYWDASMSTGKEIKIYYNPDNPNEIIADSSIYFVLIFPLLGGIAFIVGISTIIGNFKGKSTRSKLLKNGYYINAEIEEVIYNTSYSVNGRSPYIITCKWKNSTDGNTYLFKSEKIWNNPESIIEEKNITTLQVYLDMDNPKKYFVSLENLENNVVDLR
jgi:hypothetical protein